mmetsp:Transcript_56465/g.163768  ORF Transcript_56465/g.163768 Transcript_56465/m.163768 type:complete len:286 (-) Transcript_56465:896-1753(-)
MKQPQQTRRRLRPREDAAHGACLWQPQIHGTTRCEVDPELAEDVVHPNVLEHSDDPPRGVDEASEKGQDDVACHVDVTKPVHHVESATGVARQLLLSQKAKADRHLEHVVENDEHLDQIPYGPELRLRRHHQPRQGVRDRPCPRGVRLNRRAPLVLPLLLTDLLFQPRHDGQQLGKRHQVSDVSLVEQLEDAVGRTDLLLLAQRVLEGDGHELRHLRGADALAVVVKLAKALRDAPLAAEVAALAAAEAEEGVEPSDAADAGLRGVTGVRALLRLRHRRGAHPRQ